MITRVAALGAVFLISGTQPLHERNARESGANERAIPNDNRIPAGRLSNGVLELELEARAVRWFPETEAGPAIPVYAFAEPGQAARIPGPLIRVPAGTEIRVSVRNNLPEPTRVRGLHDLAPDVADSVVVAPGAAIAGETYDFEVMHSRPDSLKIVVTSVASTAGSLRPVFRG